MEEAWAVDGREREAPSRGVGLALSGGGYRAMLFHLGVLRAMNELGLLPLVDRVSSVSGGSIAAGTLARWWGSLTFDARGRATNFDERVTAPVRQLASRTMDIPAGLLTLMPGAQVSDAVRDVYREVLVGDVTLQDLPGVGEGPLFIFNAANLQTGGLFRFARPFMADWRLGRWDNPEVPLATAMAASSGFPPFLSPVTLRPATTPTHADESFVREVGVEVHRALCERVVLTDGGVYDNFGAEAIHKSQRTVLISDAGKRIETTVAPWLNWFSQLLRVREIFDDQVRALRTRWLAENYTQGARDGAYFSIRGEVVTRHLWDLGLDARPDDRALANVATRLKGLPSKTQDALIDWGERQVLAALRRAADAGALPASMMERVRGDL